MLTGGGIYLFGERGIYFCCFFCVTCVSLEPEPSQRRFDMPNSRRLHRCSSKATGRPDRLRTRRGGSRSSSRTVKSRVKKLIKLCQMPKDKFKKRLLRKYTTPEERRELYGKMVSSATLLKNYDEKSETEQVVAIHNVIKMVFSATQFGGPILGGVVWSLLGTYAGNELTNGFTTQNANTIGKIAGAVSGLYIGGTMGYRDACRMRSEFMKKTGLDKL